MNKLHYITGRTGSGKSYYVHKHIESLLKKEKLLLIVPEQYTLQAEIDLIKDLNSQGIMDVEVMSFNRLCHKVIEETGALQEVEINSSGKSMILRSLLDQHYESLHVFESISRKPGFIEKMSTLISEMKRVGVTTEQFDKVISDETTLTDRKLKDIRYILDAYQRFMATGFFDEDDKFELILDRVKHVDFIKNTYLYIDGFDSFSEHEYQLIEAMVPFIKELTLTLTLDIYATEETETLFAPAIKTMKRFRKIAQDHDIKETKTDLARPHEHKDLAAIERELFSYPNQSYDGDVEHVQLHLCHHYDDEVMYLAEHIQKCIREGSRYKDISVVTGAIDIYSPIVKRFFKDYDIPYFIDDTVSVMGHPLVIFILSSLACINSGFKYEDAARLIKTGWTDVDAEHIYSLENHMLAYGIRGSKWEKTFEDEQLDQARIAFIEPLLKLKKQLKKKNSIRTYTEAIFNYLVECHIPEKMELWFESLKTINKVDKIQESTQLWNQMVVIFDQLITLEGDDEKTVLEYSRILEAGFSDLKVGLIPPALDQVVIGSIERSKSKPTKHMMIIGLNDGVMPKKYNDEGLLLDEEKQWLKEKGIDLETDASAIMARDYFSTYIAFSKASEQIYLSYALSDHEGRALRPSMYIDQLKKVLIQLPEYSHLEDHRSPIDGYNPTTHYDAVTASMRQFADGEPIDEAWLSVLRWYERDEAWTYKTNRLKEALFYENEFKPLEKKQARALYDLPLKASVSRLERYSRCPAAHFIHYGLSPKQRKKYELLMPDIGLLFHKTLENFDAVMKEKNLEWHTIDQESVDVLVDNIVDQLVIEYNHKIFEDSHRYAYMIKKLKRVGKRAVWTLVLQVQQGEFLPYAHEVSFKLKGHQVIPPIVIELKNGDRMMLEGQIDRVDLYEKDGKQYVKIIDYKSGSKKFSLSDVYQGLQLQLLTYLEAILENGHYFNQESLYPAGVFYFKIDDPMIESELLKGQQTNDEILKLLKMDGILLKDLDIATAMDGNLKEELKSNIIPFEMKKDQTISSRSKVVDEEIFSSLNTYVKTLVETLGSEISNGVNKILPTKSNQNTACNLCDYQSICQFETTLGNEYRTIHTLKDDDVIEKIQERISNAELDK